MKWIIIAVVAIAVFNLIAPTSSHSEPTHPNEVGLYTTTNGHGATGTSVIGSPVSVYLVITKPTDEVLGTPYQTIWGFALNLFFNPVPDDDLFLLEVVLPPDNVDIGRFKDINGGQLEFVVGWALNQEPPVVVVDEAAVMAEFSFLNTGTGTTEVTLVPVDAPSMGGELVFLGGGLPPYPPDTFFPQRPMYTVSGSFESPVFLFNGEAVPVESESFGSVKALYR